MIKAVFFDLDETLCDSDTAWNIAVKETFQRLCEHAPNVSEEAITEAWTAVHAKLFQQLNAGKCSMAEVRDSRFPCLFKELDLPTDQAMEELSNFFCSRYLTSLYLYDDVAVLEKLHTYHVGIITNGAHDDHTDSQLSKVRYLGLMERIQSLTISGEIGVRKPNLEIFKVACERADVLPEEAIFVGDSVQNDIIGANRAGITSVLINRKSEALIPQIADEQPDYTISNLHDILSCLEHKQDWHRYN
ncbi:HAD family hydrolase [Candidatus Poribacteria bacterium]|nr:HAD family hydrolase [Candidatus Poribacteria bacterium]